MGMAARTILLIASIASLCFGQSVSISGTVTTAGGQPVQGAVVKLFAASLACTTKTDGTYLLSGVVGISNKTSYRLQTSGISCRNKSFVLSSASTAPAAVTLFDCGGRRVADVFTGILKQGETSVYFPFDRLSHGGMLIMHAVIGAETINGMLVCATGKNFIMPASEYTNKNLAKTITVTDWLQASKQGYASSVQQIAAYTGIYNFTLGNLTAPNFGPNTYIFDPTISAATMTNQITTVRNATSEFSSNRAAFFFKPGTYTGVDVNISYYMQALGLGMSPDSVAISGAVRSKGTSSLTNFWRGAENISVTPTLETSDVWAVSQAAPFRRMHVKGSLKLDDGGSTSGGFVADSKIDGTTTSGSQQQFYIRNSALGGWNGGVWNMFFQGVTGAPADNFPTGPISTVAQVPLIMEKPFLTIDGAGNYSVFVPALKTNSSGISWSGASQAGELIPIDQFYIALSASDNAASINAALAQGKNLLLTPGVYTLESPLSIVRPHTVVLGIGFPTLKPAANNIIPMTVADVDGVKIAGILFDAGALSTSMLLQVGPQGSAADHAANPTALFDLFCREGGTGAGKDSVSVIINSNNVIVDHAWLWRADHGTGAGWTSNLSPTGLIVNGNNVVVYALFVEHHQQYQTIWNGNNGKNYFLQCEMPYDVPNQASFNHGTTNGWASYKVGANVTSFAAWGLGIYAYFNKAAITVDNAIETPLTGTSVSHIVLMSLGGNLGQITHVINGVGGPANNNNTHVTLTTYP
jgi:hypothetical protein